MTFLHLIVGALATFSLARLFAIEDFPPIKRLRERVSQHGGWREKLATCIWCQGFWWGLVVTIVLATAPAVGLWICAPMAFRGLAGLIHERE